MRRKLARIISGLLAFAVMMSYSIVLSGADAEAGSDKGVSKVSITNVQGKKITLGKGKKLKLKAEVVLKKGSKASKKVTYKSSDTSVVKVSKNGVIKAKKLGKAKVTVQSKANAKKKVTITVTVAKKNLMIKKISLRKSLTLHMPVVEDDADEDDVSDSDDEDAEDVEEDDEEDEDDEDDEDDDEVTYSLNAKVSPSNASNQNLKWTSSNKKVVTVDQDGEITVVDAGKAVITARATDGSKKKATCKVTVIDDAEGEDDEDDDSEE